MLLLKCKLCVSRLLKEKSSLLLAAKVLTVSRLLIQRLGQGKPSSPILDTSRGQLTTLRRHLLRRIDQRLAGPKSSIEALVEAICAFCLATSSSSTDALRHYHHLRLEEIRRQMGTDETAHSHVLKGFTYYIRSLQTTKALLGRQLSESLKVLKDQPLLRDKSMQQLEDLDLKTLQRWVALDILNFVPFIKHIDPTSTEAGSVTAGWSKEAFQKFCINLKQYLDTVERTSDLLSLRKDLMELWLPVSTSTPIQSSLDILDDLRSILNPRMQGLIVSEIEVLVELGAGIAKTFTDQEAQHSSPPTPVIWDQDFVTMPLAKGAFSFKQQLKERFSGDTESSSRVLRSLESWISSIESTREVIQELRKTRWLEMIEEDEDDDESGVEVEKALQSEDPDLYAEVQKSALAKAMSSFQETIRDSTRDIGESCSTKKILFLLRTIRDVNQRLSSGFPGADLTTLETILPELQHRLATDVGTQLATNFSSSTHSRRLEVSAISHLWEGTPPLPMQPSPHTIKVLRKLSEIMASLGVDLWSDTAVSAVKGNIRQGIFQNERLNLDSERSRGDQETNGLTNVFIAVNEEDDRQPVTLENEAGVQLMFDIMYLGYALSSSAEEPSDFADAMEKLRVLSQLENPDIETLEKRARAYWERTSLLFGILK